MSTFEKAVQELEDALRLKTLKQVDAEMYSSGTLVLICSRDVKLQYEALLNDDDPLRAAVREIRKAHALL